MVQLMKELKERIVLLEGRVPQERTDMPVDLLTARVIELESQVSTIAADRTAICAALPEPSLLLADAATQLADPPPAEHQMFTIDRFPFVRSGHPRHSERVGKYHKVRVGNPSPPHERQTKCGWRHGANHLAVPVAILPFSFKLMCEVCLPDERSMARAAAEASLMSLV